MALSQLSKKYKVFKNEVLPPYQYIRTLSNGVHIGANDDESFEDQTAMTLEEISKYIKENHVDPIEEF